MAPTKMMKWGMSVHEVKCCSFSRSIGLSICFTVLLNVTSAPSTFGGG